MRKESQRPQAGCGKQTTGIIDYQTREASERQKEIVYFCLMPKMLSIKAEKTV